MTEASERVSDDDVIRQMTRALMQELDKAGFVVVEKAEIERLRAEVAELNNVLSRR